MWLLYDDDENGSLDYDEVREYIREQAYPHLKLSENQYKKIFKEIDIDGSNTVDKEELHLFVQKLVENNDIIPDDGPPGHDDILKPKKKNEVSLIIYSGSLSKNSTESSIITPKSTESSTGAGSNFKK